MIRITGKENNRPVGWLFSWVGSLWLKTVLKCQQCQTKLKLPLMQKIFQLKSTRVWRSITAYYSVQAHRSSVCAKA